MDATDPRTPDTDPIGAGATSPEALAEAAAAARAAARLAAVRATEATPGRYWGRADHLDLDDPADAVIAQDEAAALDYAMGVLDRLIAQAARYRDPGRRSRALSAIDRALADPQTGYLLRLREARTGALQARVDSGEDTGSIARELGISRRRVNALLDHNRSYVSDERRAALADIAAARAAAAAERRAARDASKAAERSAAAAHRLEQGRAYLPRFEAGEPAAKLAKEAGVSRQTLTSWLVAARADRDAPTGQGAIGS